VILMWSGQFGVNLYNTAWIIFVAYIARYMAFALKSTSAAWNRWATRWRRPPALAARATGRR